MIRQSFLFLALLCLTVLSAAAQLWRYPSDGDRGIPGRVPGSFLLEWSEVPGASAYQIVLTDNQACELGCGGDTRDLIVQGLSVLAYDLQEGIYYYWIIRPIFDDGNEGHWSQRSSFFTETPDKGPALRVSQPAGGFVRISIDAFADPYLSELQFRLVGLNGAEAAPEQVVPAAGGLQRFTEIFVPVAQRSGLHFAILTRVRNGQPSVQQVTRVVFR